MSWNQENKLCPLVTTSKQCRKPLLCRLVHLFSALYRCYKMDQQQLHQVQRGGWARSPPFVKQSTATLKWQDGGLASETKIQMFPKYYICTRCKKQEDRHQGLQTARSVQWQRPERQTLVITEGQVNRWVMYVIKHTLANCKPRRRLTSISSLFFLF